MEVAPPDRKRAFVSGEKRPRSVDANSPVDQEPLISSRFLSVGRSSIFTLR